MSALELEALADELLEQDEPDVDDQGADNAPPALLRPPAPARAPRRTVADPATRAALLDLVGACLGARIAHDVDDDDRALELLEQTAHRADALAGLLRGRLRSLPPGSLRWTA